LLPGPGRDRPGEKAFLIHIALGATMAGEEEAGERTGRIPPRGKALGIALLVNVLCLPLAFVLLYVWPLVILAIVPYVGGALGGKRVDRRTGMYIGGLAAAVMVTMLVSVVLFVISRFPGEGFDPLETSGLLIVSSCYVVAILFGALGGRHGAMAMEED
jgi:hypothetical protein